MKTELTGRALGNWERDRTGRSAGDRVLLHPLMPLERVGFFQQELVDEGRGVTVLDFILVF